MNTNQTYTYVSNSSEETARLATKLAAHIQGGEVLVFVSDVGGGKTTFIKALVKALGSSDHVSSPTFTVSKVYTAKHLRIVHFDFYRLHDTAGVKEALQEEIAEKSTVCCIEWPAIASDTLPSGYIQIQIDKDPTFEQKRTIQISFINVAAYDLGKSA